MGSNNSQTVSNESSAAAAETVQSFQHLTGFQRDLLVVTAGLDDPSGQSIKTVLEEQRGDKITHGRLYPNLDTLVNEGFVEKGEINRRTNYYTISKTGQDALNQYLEWVSAYTEA
jgi:DNA-binding PadR family transcriptional regulator